MCVCFFVVCFFVLSRPTGARRRLFEEIPMHIHFSEQYAPILPSRPPGPLLSCSPLMGLLHLILSRSSGNHQQHSSMKRCIVLRLFDCFQMSVLFRHKCREGERVGGGGEVGLLEPIDTLGRVASGVETHESRTESDPLLKANDKQCGLTNFCNPPQRSVPLPCQIQRGGGTCRRKGGTTLVLSLSPSCGIHSLGGQEATSLMKSRHMGRGVKWAEVGAGGEKSGRKA